MTTSPAGSVTGALAVGARRLSDLAADVRRHAAGLTTLAADHGWRSTAADTCRARLADAGCELWGAAALLERAAGVLDDHARTAARRAETLEQAAADALLTGGLGVLGRVLS